MQNIQSEVLSCPPGHLPASAIDRVHRVHRLFLKALEARLGDALQSQITTGIAETRQATMASCLSAGEAGWFLLALDIAPTAGHAALGFPTKLLRAVLDILLARPSGAAAGRQSHVTEIETHILRDFFDAFTGTLRKAWAPSFPVGFNRLSASPEDAKQILSASSGDAVLILTSRLKLAGVEHTFDLTLPGFLIRLAEIRATSLHAAEHTPPADAVVTGPLGAAVVELQGVLRGATLRMGDLLALKPEQILFLGAPVESTFDCLVNGKAQFSGEIVAGANRPCFQVHGLTAS
jgi:flagellar motor switch protein FliM